jgi:hypothetical protein
VAVWYRQSVDGEPADPVVIEPHAPDQSDAELLMRKALGALDKGWLVTWTSDRTFTAVKRRWRGATCVRDFWTD